jgi:DNA-binding NtrC family response regulator
LQFPRRETRSRGIARRNARRKFLWEGPLEEVSQRAVAHVERFKIQNALRESKWNKTRAAEKLGVSYKTLLTKIRGLGLELARKKSRNCFEFSFSNSSESLFWAP